MKGEICMDKNRGLKANLRERLPILVLILCLIQPLLDTAGFWQNRIGVGNTVTMLLRMLLLGGTVLLGFFLSDRKRCYLIAAAVMLFVTAGHVYAALHSHNGYEEPVLDLINLVRVYFMPLTTICFITFLRQNEKVFEAMKKGMFINVVVIFAVQVISVLTRTNPYTYASDKVGILGWFMWTNSQSAILAMLCPIAICWSVRRWQGKILPTVLITIASEAALYFLAPRLSYASLIISGFGLFVCFLIFNRKQWKQAVAVFLITALFVAAYPVSPTHKRLSANQHREDDARIEIENLGIEIPTMPEETETAPSGETKSEEDGPKIDPRTGEIILDKKTAKKLEEFYRSHDLMWSMIKRFGRDRIFKIYNYTLNPAILNNTRLMKINFCKLVMEESGTASKLFGLDLKDMTSERYDANGILVTDNYDVENDFHGMYFITGIVGLVLMFAFLLWFGIRALIAVIRKPKICFNLEMASFAIAYGLGIIHAYFTASVLRRNNASIYLALILAGLWFLSNRDKAAGEE